MRKILTFTIVALLSYTGYAQTGKVGVNETAPKATLDVKAQTANTTDGVEGILIPRVNKEKAYKMAIATTKPEESNMVYVTDTISTAIASGTDVQKATVADITEKGYYFWNGTKWVAVSGSNGQEWKDGTNAAGTNLIYANQAKLAGKDVVVTDDGRMGVGTDAPKRQLHLAGAAYFEGASNPSNPSNPSTGFLSYKKQNGRLIIMNEEGSVGGTPGFHKGDAAMAVYGSNHYPAGDTLEHYNGAVAFATNNGTDNKINHLFMNKTGNVGIGTDKPTSKLDIRGGALYLKNESGASTEPNYNTGFIKYTSNKGRLIVMNEQGTNLTGDASMGITGANYYPAGDPNEHLNGSAGFTQYNPTNGKWGYLTLNKNGNVGVGTTAPTQKLHVIGNILASGSITPDYVFQKYYDGESALKADYRMMSLSEVEDFTRKHKHLPGVPSAQEVEEAGGVLVNRATEINLEKIEELYLHTIEQEKKIEAQQERIETQQQDIEELKSLVKKLLAEKK